MEETNSKSQKLNKRAFIAVGLTAVLCWSNSTFETIGGSEAVESAIHITIDQAKTELNQLLEKRSKE